MLPKKFSCLIYFKGLQFTFDLSIVHTNTAFLPTDVLGALGSNKKHLDGRQAVSPETWLISPVNALGEHPQQTNERIAKTFNMNSSLFMVLVIFWLKKFRQLSLCPPLLMI